MRSNTSQRASYVFSVFITLCFFFFLSDMTSQLRRGNQQVRGGDKTGRLEAGNTVDSRITLLQCPARQVPDFVWGVTVTNIDNISDITTALADLKSAFPTLKPNELPPLMVRVVFDPSKTEEEFLQSLSRYQAAIQQISRYSFVMGEIVDSHDWYPYTTGASESSHSGNNNYPSRTDQLVRAMGDCVQVWEIGNEVNGEWTGWVEGHVPGDQTQLSMMREKIGRQVKQAYDIVQRYNSEVPETSRKKTAITLFYNNDGAGNSCWEKSDYELRSWAKKYLEPSVLKGVNYVLLSYYENSQDCPGLKQDGMTWLNSFISLTTADLFSTAKVGFGEVGYRETCPKKDDERMDKKECVFGKARCSVKRTCIGQEAYINKYYQTINDQIREAYKDAQTPGSNVRPPSFWGGYFYWYFVPDMVGKDKQGNNVNQERNRLALKRAICPSC